MGRSIEAFNAIASDIGVKRYEGEQENSFCLRVAYSAARFWMLAFCMDDGAGGRDGLSKQAMNRRLKDWVQGLEAIHPGVNEWFDAGGKGIAAVYNRLIDVGDLIPNGFKNAYLATCPTVTPLSASSSCITGFFDATAKGNGPCGRVVDSLITSGMLSLVRAENGAIERPEPWWKTDLEYMTWEKISSYEVVEFADIRTTRWNINRSDVWGKVPEWVDGLALARVKDNGDDSVIFAAKLARGHVHLSRITWNQGQELFFHHRSKIGNGAVATYIVLDKLHVRAKLPVGFVPGHINRFLDAAGWPVDDAGDRFNRIVRIEALPAVNELLAASYIGLEGIHNG